MRVLVLGAGQLARMMSLAGAPLNIETIAFDVGSETLCTLNANCAWAWIGASD